MTWRQRWHPAAGPSPSWSGRHRCGSGWWQEAITKYNLSDAPWQRPAAAQRVVLVVGQVETDASIRFGAPQIRSNLALLQAVRQAEPEAYLVYKPHPDVVAGSCRAGAGEDQSRNYCDAVLTGGSIQQLFRQVDALHVLTSLAGFEALLRGLEVHCWGLPFYAGWGLTDAGSAGLFSPGRQLSRRSGPCGLDRLPPLCESPQRLVHRAGAGHR